MEYNGYTVFYKEGSIPILQKSSTFPLLNTCLFIQICLLKHNLKNISLKRKILPRILPFSLAYMHILIYKDLYAGQEATVRPGHGTTDWFQIGKGVRQGSLLI